MPSLSEVVPLVEPCKNTDAPARAFPLASFTLPLIVPDCPNALTVPARKRKNKNRIDRSLSRRWFIMLILIDNS
jgi:hypothetical protein